MFLFKLLFWLSLFIIFYSYIGYGLILYGLIFCRRLFFSPKKIITSHDQPNVAIIIPAYNEEDVITAKIDNTLSLHYPRHKLSIIFITDGSTDSTADIIRKHGGFRLLHHPERRGKVAAMNRAIQYVKEPIVIFCDANTLLNKTCITEIVKHYANPEVGGVAGEKKIISSANMKAASAGEGAYWKYESLLKSLDAEFYSVVGAAGELFSLRTNLYQPVEEVIILEDFVISLRLCLKGHIVAYEPNAYAMEYASPSLKEEQKRKVRICAGAFQAMTLLKELFNIFRYPALSFQFISHRVLRWTACPVCLPLLFIFNLSIVIAGTSNFFICLFGGQVVFYLIAATGWLLADKSIRLTALFIPYYFIFMNITVYKGFYRYVTKSQGILWEKSKR